MSYPITPLAGVKPGEKNDGASTFTLGTSFTGNDSLVRIYARAGGAIAPGASVRIEPVHFRALAGEGNYLAPDFALETGDEAWFIKTDTAASPVPSHLSWEDIQNKPATFPPQIGTSATEAKAGNYVPPAATGTQVGMVKQAPSQASSTARDVAGLVSDFNALLAKLKAAGQMA